jgi:hypothetical protein
MTDAGASYAYNTALRMTSTLIPTGLIRNGAWRHSRRSDLGAHGDIRTPCQQFTKPSLLRSTLGTYEIELTAN